MDESIALSAISSFYLLNTTQEYPLAPQKLCPMNPQKFRSMLIDTKRVRFRTTLGNPFLFGKNDRLAFAFKDWPRDI